MIINIILAAILCILLFMNWKTTEPMLGMFNRNVVRDALNRSNVYQDYNKGTIEKNGITLNYGNWFLRPGEVVDYDVDKYVVSNLLEKNNIPVAKNYLWNEKITDNENIIYLQQNIRYPVVVKPTAGMEGKGITVGVNNHSDLLKAINKAKESYDCSVIIEQQLNGDEYRITVYNNKIMGVSKRNKPEIKCDGINDINTQIATFNQTKRDEYRCTNIDKNLIRSQGYNLTDIPEKDKVIIISNVANLSNGGSVEDVSIQTIHPDNIEMFKRARQISGLKITGIDFMTPNISLPYHLLENSCGILELNSDPGINIHYYAQKDGKGFMDRFVNNLFQYS